MAMDEREHTTPAYPAYPQGWAFGADFEPKEHLMSLKGRDYMNVATRMFWFIRDQRALITAGLARGTYATITELVELDREAGWALFKTTVRDVLGNESVAYGSESVKDFPDYIEKASTKSQGRALLGLGYGTIFAPEMDEGERVVDAPIERTERRTAQSATRPAAAKQPAQPVTTATWVTTDGYDPHADVELKRRVHKLGVSNVADFEVLLAYVRKHFTHYTKAAIEAEVVEREAKHEAALAKVNGAQGNGGQHNLHEAFPPEQHRGA